MLRIYSKIRVKRPCLEPPEFKNGYCIWDGVADNSIMNRDNGGGTIELGWSFVAIVSYEGDETISKVSPLGQRVESPLCEIRSKQDRAVRPEAEAGGRLGAAAVDIGVEVDERLGGPGRRIRWLIAGSAGVAERTVIAQISAESRY